MNIHFKLDGKSFKGTAEALDKNNEVQYLVDLTGPSGKGTRFTLCMDEEGSWQTDDIASPDILYAVGSEIERFDDGYDENDLPPNTYYSSTHTGTIEPIFKDGEIINESEDVEERSFD